MAYRTAFDTPNRSESIGEARWEFLGAVNDVDSRVIADLRGKPFETLQGSGASLRGYAWHNLEIVTNEPDTQEEVSLVATQKAIEAWAERWNLREPWILESACNTLELWRTGTDIMAFLPKVRHYAPPTPLYYRASFPEQLAEYLRDHNFIGYDPMAYRGPSYFKKQFMDLCEQFADEHIALQNGYAEQRGYLEWEGTHRPQHYKWAVLRQVHGYSAEAIANAVGVAPPSVQEATKNVFDLTGLKPRKLKAGRPKGSESAADRNERTKLEIRRFLQLPPNPS